MTSPFHGTREYPYHISVGAVLVNEKGEVATHYFREFSHFGVRAMDFYLLMRESLEAGESIEACLGRGLLEEFGARGNMRHYLGSIVCTATKEDFEMQKTTLYFLCDLVSIHESNRKEGDPEGSSEIRWLPPTELIPKMQEQAARIGREDIDESAVLESLVSL